MHTNHLLVILDLEVNRNLDKDHVAFDNDLNNSSSQCHEPRVAIATYRPLPIKFQKIVQQESAKIGAEAFMKTADIMTKQANAIVPDHTVEA